VARAEVMDCLKAISFNTFGGNPVAATAGSAVLDYLLSHDLQASAARVGGMLHSGLRAVDCPALAEVRGKGLMLAIEFVKPGTVEPDATFALKVLEKCKENGLLVGRGGLYGNVIRMGPPLTLTEAEAKEGLEILTLAMG
jgi:4-aminobutyrate aminotransferase